MFFLSTLFGDVGNLPSFCSKKKTPTGVFEPNRPSCIGYWQVVRLKRMQAAIWHMIPPCSIVFLGCFLWADSLIRLVAGSRVGSVGDLIPGWVVSTIFFNFHRYLLKMIRFDEPIFLDGVVQPPTSDVVTRVFASVFFLWPGNWEILEQSPTFMTIVNPPPCSCNP